MKQVYVIQYCHGGIPDEPDVFDQKKTADEFWLEQAKNEGDPLFDVDGVSIPKGADLTEYWYFSPDSDGDDEYRRWTVTLKP